MSGTHLVHWETVLLDVVQVIQFASLTELHGEDPGAGVPPVDPWCLDEAEVLEHGRELLLVPGLLLEVQLVGQVSSRLASQPLEVEAGEDVGDTGHQQLREGGREGGRWLIG